MRDVTEFLASIELKPEPGRVEAAVTYQDSCHLSHGQKSAEGAPAVAPVDPGTRPFTKCRAPTCACGSAGILQRGPERDVDADPGAQDGIGELDAAGIVATANPGCMLQMQAGVRLHGKEQRVMHVVELPRFGLPELRDPFLILVLQLVELPVNAALCESS